MMKHPQGNGDRHRVQPPRSWEDGKRHLEELIRNPWYAHLSAIGSTVYRASVGYFEDLGARNISVPTTTTSVSSPMGLGSDSLPVKTQLNGNTVYLADSLQFLLELGTRIAGKPQYYISNSFRGENVDETHLSEFSHSEIEIIGNLEDIMAVAEKYLRALSAALLDCNSEDVLSVAGSLGHLEHLVGQSASFARIRFEQAMSMLSRHECAVEEVVSGVPMITRRGEQLLMRELGAPLWLTHLPAAACPFYQRPVGDGTYCSSADLLLGPGEILGSGARCTDGGEVRESLARHQVRAEDYEWYVSMKDMAPLETAGFGLGMERFYMWVMQTGDIRDCTFWIRRNGEVVGP